jgi:YjbR protein
LNQNDFRRIVLALADVIEGAHMGHPDFRVQNRIFATIHPDPKHGMVKLRPEHQERFVTEHPEAFAPESGAWGRSGCTRVTFAAADEEALGEVVTLAWQNIKAELASKSTKRPRTTRRRKTP